MNTFTHDAIQVAVTRENWERILEIINLHEITPVAIIVDSGYERTMTSNGMQVCNVCFDDEIFELLAEKIIIE